MSLSSNAKGTTSRTYTSRLRNPATTISNIIDQSHLGDIKTFRPIYRTSAQRPGHKRHSICALQYAAPACLSQYPAHLTCQSHSFRPPPYRLLTIFSSQPAPHSLSHDAPHPHPLHLNRLSHKPQESSGQAPIHAPQLLLNLQPNFEYTQRLKRYIAKPISFSIRRSLNTTRPTE